MAIRYNNPVIPGFYPDPSVCRVGGDFYLAASSFEYFPGVPLFHSRDLVHWQPIGHALTRKSQLNLDGTACSEGIYAPTLRYHAGRFYLVTTHVWKGGGNFLVWTDDIHSGQWSEPLWLDDPDWFDPSLCFASDGKVYYTRRSAHAIVQCEIDPDRGRLLGPLREIARPFVSGDGEGPHLYEIAGRFYLLTAEGGTGPGHMICIGRSDLPWGPFEACPHNPVLTHSRHPALRIRYTGHGDLVEDAAGDWWMVFLGSRHQPCHGSLLHHLGRETFLAPVEWRNGWPLVNGGNCISLEMEAERLPASVRAAPESTRREFAHARRADGFAPEWCHLRNPEEGAVRVEEGRLILRPGRARLDEKEAPAFLGRRLDAPGFCCRVRLSVRDLCPGAEAGLTLLLSNRFHAEVGLRRLDDGGLKVFVHHRCGDLAVDVHTEAWEDDNAVLEISGDWERIRFAAGRDAGSCRMMASIERRFFCTELAGGWTGCMLGMFAQGHASSDAPAKFCAFDYERITLAGGEAYAIPERLLPM